MKIELLFILLSVVIGALYYLLQYKFVFECKHPHSKKLLMGMRINLAINIILACFCLMTLLVMYGVINGLETRFGMEFFRFLFFGNTVTSRGLLWINLAVVIFIIATFIIAMKIAVKRRDYKNLRLERLLNSHLVITLSCTAFSLLELLGAFLTYIF